MNPRPATCRKNDLPAVKAIYPARCCTKRDESYRQLLSSLVSVTASVFFFDDIKVCCGHAVMGSVVQWCWVFRGRDSTPGRFRFSSPPHLICHIASLLGEHRDEGHR